MMTIEIDFEVYKGLTNKRSDETVSYNDVLRGMLGLPPVSGEKKNGSGESWTYKGVTLPSGTELRREYKGQVYWAKIEDGKWIQDNEVQTSPSAAAFAITQSGINGWWFWTVKRPGDPDWMMLGELRPKK